MKGRLLDIALVLVAVLVGLWLYNQGMGAIGGILAAGGSALGFGRDKRRRRLDNEARSEAAKGDTQGLIDRINADFPDGVRDNDEG